MKGVLPVLIVGAGPTGLALACQCLRLGIRLRIIDKKSGPSQTSKAIGLQYRVSEVLACMGLAERFIERGGKPSTVNIYADGRRLVALHFRGGGKESGVGAFAPRPVMIPQSETESILGGAVRESGGEIEWNSELVNVVRKPEGVIATLRNGSEREEVVECAWLVSCEGAHSVARKQAGIDFLGKTYPLAFLMADVELRGELDHGENHVWVHRDGSFAALPFAQPGRWRLFVEVTRQAEEARGNVTLSLIEQLMRERAPQAAIAIANPTWISPFTIDCRMVNQYRSGRVLLAGDAAHIHSPTGGQGIATGIQDAANLAWKLARVLKGAPETLLDTYDEERRQHAREVLRETNRTTTIFFAPTKTMRLLRDRIVLPILRNAWVQRRMFAKLSQLHVHYRGSRLSRHQDRRWFSRTRIRAGDRAPDILLKRMATGETTSLFRLLQAHQPVLLIGPGTQPGNTKVERLIELVEPLELQAWVIVPSNDSRWQSHPRSLEDTHDELNRLYGLRGEFLCLIRPDDHVALIQIPIDETGLANYLRFICAPSALAAARIALLTAPV